METALENSVWVTSPEFAGWLVKRGFRWRKLWTKRWVALHGTEIAYMAAEPTDNTKDMVITKSQILPSTVINRDDIEGHPHGFAIHINDGSTPVWYLRAESTREKKSWLMRLGHVQEIIKWLDNFEKVKVLGVGATGIVYELKHKQTGRRFALKEMEIKNKAQMQMALSEAEMLKEIMENISHPNIMHIDKVFQVGLKFYLVFPLCTGGELYEHVIRRGHFSERDAAVIMRDLMSGLHALHQRDILHLDIKPENILFETDADDSRIKITDFGLSKLFNHEEDEGNKSISVGDMAKKLKSFQESGVLQRDRLRGTVGYMSPELILAGVSSAATDVWAAGVVLYILLCGHPPFQSKSNREILERSARGQYSLEGKEWEGVSDMAKDLVRGMLTVDPEARISVEGALKHPWLEAVAGVYPDTTLSGQGADGTADVPPAPPQTMASPPPVHSGNNLNSPAGGKPRTTHLGSALSNLSTHVKDRKVEKMAVSFTRLVSSLQSDKRSQDKKRMIDTLLDKSGNNFSSTGEPTADDGVYVLSQEYKEAVIHAFKTIGMESGKLTAEQFINFMNQFAFEPSASREAGAGAGSMFTGIPALIMCRFVDRDGDGFISAEDVFTTQALILQRSKEFLRVVFRLYVESVWYPGRQLNIINLQLQTNRGSGGRGGGTSILPDASREKGSTIMEPPKYITGKHVAAVFERVGLDPEGGVKVFNALCEAMRHRDDMFTDARNADSAAVPISSPAKDPPIMSPLAKGFKKSPPADRAADGNIFLSKTTTNRPIPKAVTSPKRNAALDSLLMDDDDDEPSTKGSTEGLNRGSGLESSSSLQDVSSLVDMSGEASINSKSIAGSKGTAMAIEEAIYSDNSGDGSGDVDYRMDFDDFVRVQQIDDVLVAALLKKPRSKIAKLFHGAIGVDGAATGAAGEHHAADSVQQRLQDEMCAALTASSIGTRPSNGLTSPSGRTVSGTDPSTPVSLLGGLGRAVVEFATGGSASKDGKDPTV